MKTRRVFQIIVGVLSLLAALDCICSLTLVGLLTVLPISSLPDWVQGVFTAITSTFDGIAASLGLSVKLAILFPIAALGLPAALLFVGGILMLLRERNKPVKHIVGNVLSLVGIASLTGVMFWLAPKILVNLFAELANLSPMLADVNIVLPVRIAWGVEFAIFAFFIVGALAIKPKKKEEVLVEDTANTGETEEITDNTETEEVTEPIEEAAVTTNYVPETDISVNDVMEQTYGKHDETLSDDTVKKIKKVRALYEMNAITEDEYFKIVDAYLNT